MGVARVDWVCLVAILERIAEAGHYCASVAVTPVMYRLVLDGRFCREDDCGPGSKLATLWGWRISQDYALNSPLFLVLEHGPRSANITRVFGW